MAAVLVVGNFLTAAGRSVSTCQSLALRLTAAGLETITTSSRMARMSRLADMVATAWRERRRYESAYVEVYSGPAFVWAEAVCWTLRRAGKPYVLALHGGSLPVFARRWPGRVRRLLRSAAAVVAPSSYLQQAMRPFREDISIVPNALELSSYRFRLRSAPQPRLVWLRAFNHIYNPSLAARVVALLCRDFPDVRLCMVGPDKGDGSLEEFLKAAGELGVLDRIERPGGIPKSKVPEVLDAADIFLNTTHVDNTPVSVLEAMASGLCVVTTNVGGIPYLASHEEDALLVKDDDAEGMAAAVRRVLLEPGLAGRLSRGARNTAEQVDWSHVLPRWISLLQTIAAGRHS